MQVTGESPYGRVVTFVKMRLTFAAGKNFSGAVRERVALANRAVKSLPKMDKTLTRKEIRVRGVRARTTKPLKIRVMTNIGTPIPYTRQLRGLRVLIVDDNREDRMLLLDFLGQQGCRVYVADDGHDGYRKAQTVLPEVILMDITMPVCDGLVACRRIKADPATRAIPLIFLTASTLPHERVEGLTAGAVDYVTKPFDFEEVRLRLSIHLKVNPEAADDSGLADVHPAGGGNTLDAILVRAARKILLAHLDDTPELAALAQAVGTNSRRLNLAFKRCIGMTVFDFLREERMKEALRLLSQSSLDVQTIAKALGYGSGANFSTAFRERFGHSPRHLRRTAEKSA
jgi:DNA-binding response OmpR family regulator